MRWAVLLLAACGSGASSSTTTTGGTTGGTTATATDPYVQHNLDALNQYRAQNGAPPLQLSDALDQFATTGSQELAAGGQPHAHFNAAGTDGSSGFCSGAGENQAPDWPVNGDENGTIDAILQSMMGEQPPNDGHRQNILNPDFALVGIGLVVQNGGLYLTNDFSNACP